MKDLLGKEHDCYKSMHYQRKASVLTPSPSIEYPIYGVPHFYSNILIPLLYDFSKMSPHPYE